MRSAWASRGSGPHRAHATNARIATITTAGTKYRSNHVGKPLDRRTGSLRLADHPHDLCEQRVAADPLGADRQAARPVDRRAGDGRPGRFFDRNRLAAHHRFVDRALALHDDAVGGDLLPGTHPQEVADLDVGERHVGLAPVSNAAGGFRRHPEELPNRRTRLSPRTQLEHLPEQHEDGDDDRSIEVGLNDVVDTKAVGKQLRRERGSDAEEIRRADAEGDQREHVRIAGPYRGPAALEKRPAAPEDHRGGECEPDPVADPHVDAPAEPHAEHHVAHRQYEDRQTERGPDPHPPGHVDEFRIRTFVECRNPRLQRHAADRA